jgi:hypothetical protein
MSAAAPVAGFPNWSVARIAIAVGVPATPFGTVAELALAAGGPAVTVIGLEVTGVKPSAAKIRVLLPTEPRICRSEKRT